jgi:hypothetical protein
MVNGLDVFSSYFEEYKDQYILIGGSACAVQMEDLGLEFRVTKDLDIVLIVEALTPAFVEHFWNFIHGGKYDIAEVNQEKRFYRFLKPKNQDYPAMLELFARHPDTLPMAEDLHITDIPTGEDMSSLSAILLDEDYYAFTLANSEIVNNLRVASYIALIALKARAFLNNLQRKEEGQQVQSGDIFKHRSDVIRLTAVISGNPAYTVVEKVKVDIALFIERGLSDPEQIQTVLKSLQLGIDDPAVIIRQLRIVFGIGG